MIFMIFVVNYEIIQAYKNKEFVVPFICFFPFMFFKSSIYGVFFFFNFFALALCSEINLKINSASWFNLDFNYMNP